jgi:cold shock CspA family protein
MSKSKESWNKKEREKKKEKDRKAKFEKKLERKEHSKDGRGMDSMMAYLDENGNLSSTPPDPSKVIKINAEDIQLGVPKQAPMSEEELERKGTVTFFNASKGFGFIKDDETKEDYYVHLSGLIDAIKDNNKVVFEIENTPRGRSAVGVKLLK